jgi:hypothetical protein
MQAVQAARTDDEVTAAVAANNWVAERAAEADDATPRRVFADLVKRLEPLLDRVRCRALLAWQAGVHIVWARGGAPLPTDCPAVMARQVASKVAALFNAGRETLMAHACAARQAAPARLAPALEARMSDEQRAALLGNAALLLLAANRTGSAREIAAGLAARCFPPRHGATGVTGNAQGAPRCCRPSQPCACTVACSMQSRSCACASAPCACWPAASRAQARPVAAQANPVLTLGAPPRRFPGTGATALVQGALAARDGDAAAADRVLAAAAGAGGAGALPAALLRAQLALAADEPARVRACPGGSWGGGALCVDSMFLVLCSWLWEEAGAESAPARFLQVRWNCRCRQ